MGQPVTWLPPSALLEVRTAAPVGAVVAAWSREWLSIGTLAATPRWECYARSLGLTGLHPLGADATLRLAGLLLGREITERHLRTKADRKAIEHLVESACEALASELARLVVSGNDTDAERFTLPIVGDDGFPLLRIEAGREALVTLAKHWSGEVRVGAPPVPLRSTLGTQNVRLAARLGTSRLALPEIEALAPGDVLTLDTPVPDPVDAWIDEQAAAEAALTIVPGEDRLKLQITRPASQW